MLCEEICLLCAECWAQEAKFYPERSDPSAERQGWCLLRPILHHNKSPVKPWGKVKGGGGGIQERNYYFLCCLAFASLHNNACMTVPKVTVHLRLFLPEVSLQNYLCCCTPHLKNIKEPHRVLCIYL